MPPIPDVETVRQAVAGRCRKGRGQSVATVLGLGTPGPDPCSGYRQETPRGRVKCPYPGPPPIVDLGQGPSFNVGDVSQ